MGRLNERQIRFCREYVKSPDNASEAARKAGYSERTARIQASQLLTRHNIQAELARLRSAAETAAVLSVQEACEILTSIARSNVADYFDATGRIAVRPDDSTGDPRAVESVKQTYDGDGNPVIQFKLAPKIAAIERLSKLRGWDAPAKQELTGADGAPLVPVERPEAMSQRYLDALREAINEPKGDNAV
jgi:phage terminase small subunit